MTTTTSAGEPPLQRFHEGFPWGMSLGYLHRADSGDLLPAIWPTAPGGVSVTYSDVHETLTNQWLEYGVLDLLLALPPGAAQIHVFDFGIRKRFSTLAQLQAQKSYRVYSDLSEAQKGLDGIEAIARHRHHQLFDDETPTLVDFNQRASRPEPFHVLLVNLDDFPRDPGAANRLTLLLREAIPAGIYLLAYGRHTASIADEQASSSGGVSPDAKVAEQFKTFLSTQYPNLLVCSREGASGSAASEIRVLGGEGSQGMASALASPALYVSAPPPALAKSLAALRERDLANEATASVQDFLCVPVGDTLDGKQCIEWRMGPRSGNLAAIVIGMSGMGKSTLLNNLLVGIAEKYTCEQIRLYLMDYKDGTEFRCFDQHPNVERIFLDNEDTQAAIDMLSEFRAAIKERSDLFGRHNGSYGEGQTYVRNIDDYNANHPESPLPRLVLVIDEFQRLLDANSPTATRVGELLVDVTKRGRSVGIHSVLATQSLLGLYDIKRLLGQISLRVSFKVNSLTDAEEILELGNVAPLSLAPFEFVINTDSGKKAANVLVRGRDLRVDIARRMAEIRASRSAHLCLTPVIVTSGKDTKASDAASPGAAAGSSTGSKATSSSAAQRAHATEPENHGVPADWEGINDFLAQALQADLLDESDLQ